MPKRDVLERFANALSKDLRTVSRAFLRDAGIPVDGEEMSPAEVHLIHRYRALPDTDQARLRAILDCFEQYPNKPTQLESPQDADPATSARQQPMTSSAGRER